MQLLYTANQLIAAIPVIGACCADQFTMPKNLTRVYFFVAGAGVEPASLTEWVMSPPRYHFLHPAIYYFCGTGWSRTTICGFSVHRELTTCATVPNFTEREIELSLRFSLVSLYFAATTVWMFPLQQSTHIIVVTLPPLTHLILSPNEPRLRLSYVTSRNTCLFF